MKRCAQCGLPNSYPGIQFNEDDICNYCVYFDLYKDREKIIKLELAEKFVTLIKKVKKENHPYHCLVAYSGGKDSTFLLYYLKTKFKLNILACTLDNGFMSPTALENIEKITKILGIENRIIKPGFEILREVFTYALRGKVPYPKEILAMVSPVCAVCIGMVFGATLDLATELKIPLMFTGFTPGQYPAISLENFLKVNSCLFFSDKIYRDDPEDVLKILADPIKEQFGEKAGRYFFRSQYIPKGMKAPKVLFPFHALLEYDEKEIIRQISRLGWVRPEDTDSCSTNCLLNSLGIYTCLKQMGYHPYVGELSYLVLQGRISRKEAIAAEQINGDSPAIKESLKRLRLDKSEIFSG